MGKVESSILKKGKWGWGRSVMSGTVTQDHVLIYGWTDVVWVTVLVLWRDKAALRKGSKCRLTLSSREFVRYHHDGADRRGAGAVAERALHPDLQAAGGEILGLARALETSTKLPLLILPSFTNWGPSIKHRSLWRHSHSNHHSY